MVLGPLDERALVVAGVDRGADDDGVIVRRRGLGLARMEMLQVDGRAVVLERRGDARGDLGGVAVGAGKEDEDAWHVISVAGRARAHSRETPQQIAAFYGPPDQATVPTSAPMPAVTAIARAPQAMTRIVAARRGAPPSRAPRSPSRASASKVTTTMARPAPAPASAAAASSGSAAPAENASADVHAAWNGRASRPCVEAELVAGVRLERVAARERVATSLASAGGRPRCS